MTTTSAVPSRKKNERAVKAMFFCMVTFRSFLPAGTSHGQRKGGVRNNGSSPENWIRYHARTVLPIHQNPSLRIHREPTHWSGHRTRQSQLARWIKKKQHALTDAVALATR